MSTLNGQQVLNVTSHATAFTLTAADNGTAHVSTDAIAATLPDATPGLWYLFIVGAAQELTITPASGETISGTDGVPGSADATLVADAIGETIELFCAVAGSWRVASYTGTWTLT